MTFIAKNFELILFLLVIVSGVITFIDWLWLAKKREAKAALALTPKETLKLPILIDYSRSFFPILLLVFLLRSFIIEPYRIPSGSLKPTLETGDYIVVNKFSYGLRMPVFHHKFLALEEPKRGDIFVFRYPHDPAIDYIKRVIGVPGDHLVYHNKILIINGKVIPQKFVGYAIESEPGRGSWKVEKRIENLNGVKHAIYIRPDAPAIDFDITVPADCFFAMGDNRDNSSDSRYWGFVPEENIIGKAFIVLFSWDSDTDTFRWSRIGKMVH